MLDQTELRNKLFEKYFEVTDGIEITNLLKYLSYINQTWTQLHQILEQHVEYYSDIEKIKKIEYKNKKYLILKFKIWDYMLIDLETKQTLTKEDVESNFEELFLTENFPEIREETHKDYIEFNQYNGNIQDLIDFYNKNQEIFTLPTRIYYKLTMNDAWTYLGINLISSQIQLGFETPNQYLYEQLFLNYDLTPCSMQDAQSKIGVEKMQEMFERIKQIKIPKNDIPEQLYQSIQNQLQNTIGPKLVMKA